MATVDGILSMYKNGVSSLGLQLREFLLGQLENIIEYPDAAANIIGYGYGPGYKSLVCTIIPSKKGIKLGFYKGSELPDPCNILRGSGKVHRYVEIESGDDLNKPAIRKLVKEAQHSYELRKRQK
jgi:hypothetical protein